MRTLHPRTVHVVLVITGVRFRSPRITAPIVRIVIHQVDLLHVLSRRHHERRPRRQHALQNLHLVLRREVIVRELYLEGHVHISLLERVFVLRHPLSPHRLHIARLDHLKRDCFAKTALSN